MRRIINSTYITLDGVIEGPHLWPSLDRPRDERFGQIQADLALSCDAMLMGRHTYDGFAPVWPTRSGDPLSDQFNAMPKFVVSTTLEAPDWSNSHLIKGDLAREIPKLKEQFGGDIAVHGSGQLVNALKEGDLVDEYRLMVFPVVLGKGKRLFADGGGLITLKLEESKQVGPDGVVILTYQRADAR